MNFRYYTEDDFVNGVPCIYKHRNTVETVQPVMMGGRHPFDGGRKLTVKTSGGHVFTRTIGGSDLTQVLYAAA